LDVEQKRILDAAFAKGALLFWENTWRALDKDNMWRDTDDKQIIQSTKIMSNRESGESGFKIFQGISRIIIFYYFSVLYFSLLMVDGFDLFFRSSE